MDKKLIWVRFNIELSDSEYPYSSDRSGKAGLTARVPRSILENLNADTLLNGLLAAAIVDYDKPEEEKES